MSGPPPALFYPNTLDSPHPVRIAQVAAPSGKWFAVYVTEAGKVSIRRVCGLALVEREHAVHGPEQDIVALIWDQRGQAEIAQDDPDFVSLWDEESEEWQDDDYWLDLAEAKRGTDLVVSKTEEQPW